MFANKNMLNVLQAPWSCFSVLSLARMLGHSSCNRVSHRDAFRVLQHCRRCSRPSLFATVAIVSKRSYDRICTNLTYICLLPGLDEDPSRPIAATLRIHDAVGRVDLRSVTIVRVDVVAHCEQSVSSAAIPDTIAIAAISPVCDRGSCPYNAERSRSRWPSDRGQCRKTGILHRNRKGSLAGHVPRHWT
jgi:hypothetical protein